MPEPKTSRQSAATGEKSHCAPLPPTGDASIYWTKKFYSTAQDFLATPALRGKHYG
jgi:hypothetical protein